MGTAGPPSLVLPPKLTALRGSLVASTGPALFSRNIMQTTYVILNVLVATLKA